MKYISFGPVLILSHLTNEIIEEDEDSFDGSDVSDASSSGNEQEDEEAAADVGPPEEAKDMYDAVPSNEATASVFQEAAGPSDARGHVRDSMGSLTLGPRGDVPKKRNGTNRLVVHVVFVISCKDMAAFVNFLQ